MKVFFDTNVYVAEALLGEASTRLIEATVAAGWRMHKLVRAGRDRARHRRLLRFHPPARLPLASAGGPPRRARHSPDLAPRRTRRPERQSDPAGGRWLPVPTTS